jgi:hypothetical protein
VVGIRRSALLALTSLCGVASASAACSSSNGASGANLAQEASVAATPDASMTDATFLDASALDGAATDAGAIDAVADDSATTSTPTLVVDAGDDADATDSGDGNTRPVIGAPIDADAPRFPCEGTLTGCKIGLEVCVEPCAGAERFTGCYGVADSICADADAVTLCDCVAAATDHDIRCGGTLETGLSIGCGGCYGAPPIRWSAASYDRGDCDPAVGGDWA